ncbi:unnamed protein product [Larinioides sclopetarius]|uniref:Uncharacterized protein n=1 Tax=Larinioides sclopetarius TaxID=280406 RepID=A0AAV2ATE2_9ARAC
MNFFGLPSGPVTVPGVVPGPAGTICIGLPSGPGTGVVVVCPSGPWGPKGNRG